MNTLEYAHDLMDRGEPDAAMRVVCEVLNETPNDPRALSVAAYIEMGVERFGLAYNLLSQAVAHMPNQSALWNNLGMCALGCMRLDDAEKHLKKALQVDPKNAAAMNNLALVYVNKCEAGLAIEWADRANKISPPDGARDETRGYACLMLGKWREGWQGFEGALGGKIRRPRSYVGEGYWDGTKGLTVVARGEQGIGDEISFASVLPDAAKDCKKLVFECDKRLEGLFKRSFPDLEIHGTRFVQDIAWPLDVKPDAHILAGSLCKFYRNETSAFPGTAYLKADPERVLQWKALLATLGPRPKIGIAWTGGRHNTHKTRRSTNLEALLPILRQDCNFVSLQYKDASAEIDAFTAKHGIKIHHWARAAEAVDYDETAALVASLDLVITVQTAVVHLAGALGVPCWVMVPNRPHWRYGLTGDRMPWYQCVKLYRQKTDWAGVVNRISTDLRGHFGPLRDAP